MDLIKHTLILWLLGLPFITVSQSTNQNFEFRNLKLEQDFEHEGFGTTGALLTFEYRYHTQQTRLLPVIPEVYLRKHGIIVYENQNVVLPLVTNKWSTISYFIPYREIILLGDEHKNVELEFILSDIFNYKLIFNYKQPTRYAVEICLKNAQVVKKLRQYDKSLNPVEWLPDPFFEFTTNNGQRPIYRSKTKYNSYHYNLDTIRMHILKGEQLKWTFYDKDGGQKELLGTYMELGAEGDFKDEVLGVQRKNIINLDFDYIQKELAIQPLSIYSDGTVDVNGRKGVAITVEYDFGGSYIGQKALAELRCYDKQGNNLKLQHFMSLGETPAKEEVIILQRKGSLSYFIPFYAWDGESSEIEFNLVLEDGQTTKSARHIIHKPINFGKYVYYSAMELEEDYTFQGAKGVRLALRYQVKEIHEYSDMALSFSLENGEALPFDIYQIYNQESGFKLKQFPFKVKQPREEDTYYFFIPYKYLKGQKIRAILDIIPEFKINLINEVTPELRSRVNHRDVDISIARAEAGFLNENYGQVLTFQVNTPQLFLKECKLQFKIYQNNQLFDNFTTSGKLAQAKDNGPTYLISETKSDILVGIPHRSLSKSDQIKVETIVTDLKGECMSDTLVWKWQAPEELWNREVTFLVKQIKFAFKPPKDTLDYLSWNYAINVGHEKMLNKPILKKLNGKARKTYERTFSVNREDNIEVYLYHPRSKRKIRIWKGDLDKWRQAGFVAMIKDVSDVKRAKVVATTPYEKELEQKKAFEGKKEKGSL